MKRAGESTILGIGDQDSPIFPGAIVEENNEIVANTLRCLFNQQPAETSIVAVEHLLEAYATNNDINTARELFSTLRLSALNDPTARKAFHVFQQEWGRPRAPSHLTLEDISTIAEKVIRRGNKIREHSCKEVRHAMGEVALHKYNYLRYT